MSFAGVVGLRQIARPLASTLFTNPEDKGARSQSQGGLESRRQTLDIHWCGEIKLNFSIDCRGEQAMLWLVYTACAFGFAQGRGGEPAGRRTEGTRESWSMGSWAKSVVGR